MSQIIIENIPITFTRKNIKNLNIRVVRPNAEVKVSAPYLMSMKRVEDFIIKHKTWIENTRCKVLEQENNLQKQYITGDEIFVWGKKYVLEVLPSTRWNLQLNNNNFRANFSVTKNCDVQKKFQYLKKWYKTQVLQESVYYFDKWEKITGLAPDKITSRWTKSIWGSCDKAHKRIMLNSQLATKDKKYLDYVILHELTHLKYSNHGQGFQNYMTKYMPDWRVLRKELNG